MEALARVVGPMLGRGNHVINAVQDVEALRARGFVDVEARRMPDPNGAVVITAGRGT